MTKQRKIGQSIFSILCALGLTVALVGTTTSTGPAGSAPAQTIA